MTRTPHDQLAKVLLPAWLSPFGQAISGRAIASEVRESDVYFVPERAPTRSEAAALGFLATLCRVPRLFEVYRNAVSGVQLEESVAKTLELRNAHRRAWRRKGSSRPKKRPAPELCLLTPTFSAKLAHEAVATEQDGDPPGVYRLPGRWAGVVVAVHPLPVEPATLGFRLFGHGRVQRQALGEVEALGSTHPLRTGTMQAIAADRQQLEHRSTPMSQADRDFLENTQRLYEQWEQRTLARGKAEGKAEGEAKGEAKGKAAAVLAIVEARQLAVTAAQRKQIGACTDLGQLEGWIRAALTAPSVQALLGTSSPSPRRAPRRARS